MKNYKFIKLFLSILIALLCFGYVNNPVLAIEGEDLLTETAEAEIEETVIQDNEEETAFNTSDIQINNNEPEEEITPPLNYINTDNNTDLLIHDSVPMLQSLEGYDLPLKYSLVSEGKITPVKNQGNYGTCWAHAAMASAESTYLVETGETLDLSELHLAYSVWNNRYVEDDENLITNDGNTTSLRGTAYNNTVLDTGGNVFFSTFALASGIGAVSEKDVPYQTASSVIRNGLNYPIYEQTYDLYESRFMSPNDRETIKQAIINNGAVASSFYSNTSFYDQVHHSYYQDIYKSCNHAITIVGWDDNFSHLNMPGSVALDGAWLCKNSWGSSYGEDGYFWLSYYDKGFLSSTCAQYFLRPTDNNRHIYQYDGSNSTYHSNIQANRTVKIANIFKASRNETLKEVSFVAGASGVSYEIRVYVSNNKMSDPTKGTLLTEATTYGYMADAGFHIVPLETEVELSANEYFSIVISQTSSKPMELYFDKTSGGSDYTCHNDTTGDLSFRDIGYGFENRSASGATERIKAYTYTSASSEDGDFSINARGELWRYNGHKKDVSIPESVLTVGRRVFADNEEIETVYIPSNVREISSEAFSNCKNLRLIYLENPDIVLGKNITESNNNDLAVYLAGEKKDIVENDKFSQWILKSSSEYGFYNNGLCWKSSNQDVHSSTCSSTWEIDLKTDDTVKLTYLVDSEEGCDKLTVKIDGRVEVSSVSGKVSAMIKRNLSAGIHTLEASYTKDSSVSKYEDFAAIFFEDIGNVPTFPSAKSVMIIEHGTLEEFEYFRDLKDIEDTLKIPSGIKTIPGGQFAGNDNLNKVILPDSLIKIGNNAFENCSNLKDINIPFSVTNIGKGTFNNCEELKMIFIPSTVLDIANISNCIDYYFTDIKEEDNKWEGIYGENGINVVFNSTALDCSLWKTVDINKANVVIPEGITVIPDSMFAESDSLKTVDLPKTLKSIGHGAFYHCYNLRSLYIPKNVDYIGNDAFWMRLFFENSREFYESLNLCDSEFLYAGLFDVPENEKFYTLLDGSEEEIIIPEGITQIRYGELDNFYNLKRVVIPSSVKTIDHTFYNCPSLKFIYIPDTVETVECNFTDTDVFTNARTLPKHWEGLKTKTNLYLDYDYNDYLFWAKLDEKGESIIIPSSFEFIPENAFRGMTNVLNITVPDSIKKIEKNAFKNCTSLKTIHFDRADFKFDDTIFDGCSKDLKIYYSKSINELALNKWQLENSDKAYGFIKNADSTWVSNNKNKNSTTAETKWEIYLAEKTEISIPWSVSSESNYDKLTIAIGPTKYVSASGTQSGTLKKTLEPGLYVLTATYSKNYSFSSGNDEACITLLNDSNFVFTNGSTYLKYYCSKTAEDSSFWLTADKNAETLEIPEGISYIPADAFEGFNNLKTISIPNTVSYLVESPFKQCDSLKYIFIPSSVTKLTGHPFKNGVTVFTDVSGKAEGWNNSLNNVTVLYNYSKEEYTYWMNLDYTAAALILPESVIKIPSGIFEEMNNLESLFIPDSVSEIADGALPLNISIETYKDCYAAGYLKEHGYNFTELDHQFSEQVYKWSDDLKTVIATRVCLRDGNHTESETANTVYEIIEESDCVNQGLGRYTASFENQGFKTQTKDIEIEELGHIFNLYNGYDSDNHWQICQREGCEEIAAVSKHQGGEIIGDSFPVCDICKKPYMRYGEFIVSKDKYDRLKVEGYGILNSDFVIEKSIIELDLGERIVGIEKGAISDNIEIICLSSDAPSIAEDAFESLTLTVYYPEDKEGYAELIAKDFGGDIKWLPLNEYVQTKYSVFVDGKLVKEVYRNDVLSELKAEEREGYTFENYYLGDIIFDLNNGITEDLKLTGRYLPNEYQLSFDPEDGELNIKNIKVTYDSFYGELPVPYKEGYDFNGWLLNEEIIKETDKVNILNDTALKASYVPHKYSINLDLKGGTSNNPLYYTIETETFTLSDALKERNEFLGWSTAEDPEIKKEITINKGSTGDLYFIANYRALAYYAINYKLNGGENNSSNTDHLDKAKQSLTLKNPIKEGYTFNGWYNNSSYTGSKITKLTAPSTEGEEITLYAKWNPIKYILNYNSNGGKGKMNSIKDIYYDADSFNLDKNVFERAGYTFTGWSTNAKYLTLKQEDKLNTPFFNDGDEVSNLTNKAGSYTLYAIWNPVSYNITSNYNGGTISKGNDIPYTTTVEKTIALPVLIKDGYKFIGWYNTSANKKITSLSKITSYINIEARFETVKYSISYSLNGGKITSNKNEYSSNYDVESNLTLPAVEKKGYIFDGFYLSYNSKTKEYSDKISSKDDLVSHKGYSKVTLYAKWNPVTYKAVFEYNGERLEPVTLTYDQTYSLSSPSFTSMSGKTPVKYSYINDLNKTVTLSSLKLKNLTAINEKEVVITPLSFKYETYKITYILNGGINNKANPSSYNVDSCFNLSNPVKKGYEFVNWTDSNGSIITFIDKGTTSNITLTAGFKPVAYTIKYTDNKFNKTLDDNTYYIDTNTFSLPLLSKEGYKFEGWYTGWNQLKDTVSGSKITSIKKGSTINYTLYAKWTPVTYTIKFNKNGGTGSMSDLKMTYDTAKALTANKFKNGNKEFLCWNTKADGTGISFNDSYTITNEIKPLTSAVTLYAIWG